MVLTTAMSKDHRGTQPQTGEKRAVHTAAEGKANLLQPSSEGSLNLIRWLQDQ